MLRIRKNGRVLVIDGGSARVFHNAATPPAIMLSGERHVSQSNPSTHDQGSGAPGRVHDFGGRRSAMESPDYHQQAEDHFIAGVADQMAKDLTGGQFESFVLVAPPHALSIFRKAMQPALARALLLAVDKDLTKHDSKTIGEIVGKALEEASA